MSMPTHQSNAQSNKQAELLMQNIFRITIAGSFAFFAACYFVMMH